jgi:pilus assembly protein Flp/PilA
MILINDPGLARKLHFEARTCTGQSGKSFGEKRAMKNAILNIYTKAQILSKVLKNEDGQDLVEYALVMSMVTLGAVAGMATVASDVNVVFTSIGTILTAST